MKKQRNIKIIPLIILLIITIGFIKYKVTNYKCKEITYAVEHHLTNNIFSPYNLYGIDNFHLSFSDGKIAIVKVYGMKKKSPHERVTYDVFLEKNSSGVWKVKKVYEQN